MTKEEIKQCLALSLEYYKQEVFGTEKESEKPSEERVDWIYERMKNDVSEDIEEAAKEYVKTLHDIDGCEVGMCRRIFVAGAKWAFKQGWTFDAHKGTFGICFDGDINNLLDSLKDREEVTVQIRKK